MPTPHSGRRRHLELRLFERRCWSGVLRYLDRDAGGHDEEGAGEPVAAGMAGGMDYLPGDQHRHDSGSAGAGREFSAMRSNSGFASLLAPRRCVQILAPAAARSGATSASQITVSTASIWRNLHFGGSKKIATFFLECLAPSAADRFRGEAGRFLPRTRPRQCEASRRRCPVPRQPASAADRCSPAEPPASA
jgi:hypothetical protein